MDDTRNTTSPGKRTVALHACCGPCLIEPLDALVDEGADVTIVFYNPNIHPSAEYERRRDTLTGYAVELGVRVVELPYDPAEWERATSGATTRSERCAACYRLRLSGVAAWAASSGHDVIATTLTVSPYQDPVEIERAGVETAGEHGVAYLTRDYRDRYAQATRRSRDQGMYRQNYCGCAPSMAEAQAEREARRAARKRDREGEIDR